MASETEYDIIIRAIAGQMNEPYDFAASSNSEELEQLAGMQDYLTSEQRLRDKQTTQLYGQFVESHKQKQVFVKQSKKLIFYFCLSWVSVFVLICAGIPFYILRFPERTITDIIALISVIVPIVVAIIGTLDVVAKYVFPEDEERHITEIVKAIQENDLNDKLANLKQIREEKNPTDQVES